MRGFQEFKGQSTRLDYNRERGEFVARPVPHPFVVCSAASEVKTEPKSRKYALSLQHQTGPVLEPTRSRAFSLSPSPKPQQDPSRNEPLAGYEDSMWTSAVVGLALAAIVIWVGFVVS